MDFLGMGLGEILLIIIIAIIFVGPGKIVDFSRTLGKWVRAIRKASNDFTVAVTREVEKAKEEPPSSSAEEAEKTTQSHYTSNSKDPVAGTDNERHP